MEFNIQNTLQDALIAHKYLIHMYCQYGIECSNEELRNLFNTLSKTAEQHDLKIFEIMNEKGFYPTEPAKSTDLKQAIKMHEEMQKTLDKSIKKSSKN